MAAPSELKNWKFEVVSGQMHAVGQSGGVRIKTSPIVKITGNIAETAIGAKFLLNPSEKNKNYWDVSFRLTYPLFAESISHLLK